MLILNCECEDCHSQPNTIPVAYEVLRAGKTLNVCTRCNLSSDTVIGLLVNENTPGAPFVEYDALGAMGLALDLAKQEGE